MASQAEIQRRLKQEAEDIPGTGISVGTGGGPPILGGLVFYNGVNLPLALNRETGEVNLVLINPRGLASVFGDKCLAAQFLIHRTGLGGDVITTMIREMCMRREPLHTLGVLFGLISEQSTEQMEKSNADRLAGIRGTRQRRPYGPPSAKLVRRAGIDGRRLNEVFPLSDIQQNGHRPVFRYEDAVWLFRGPSIGTANPNEPGLGGSSAANASLAVDNSMEPTSAVPERSESPQGDADAAAEAVSIEVRILSPPPTSFDQRQMLRHIFWPLMAYGANLKEKDQEKQPTVTRSEAQSEQPDTQAQAQSQSEASEFLQFLLFALLEYCRALKQHRQIFSQPLQSLLIDLFMELSTLDVPQYYRLQQLLMYRAIQPHVTVALKLVRLSDRYPPAFQHALDMLWRLEERSQIVDVLLAKRLPLRAANFALQHEVRGISVIEVLKCALQVDEREIAVNNDPDKLSRAFDTGERGTFLTVHALMQRYMDRVCKEEGSRPSPESLEKYDKIADQRRNHRPAEMLVL